MPKQIKPAALFVLAIVVSFVLALFLAKAPVPYGGLWMGGSSVLLRHCAGACLCAGLGKVWNARTDDERTCHLEDSP